MMLLVDFFAISIVSFSGWGEIRKGKNLRFDAGSCSCLIYICIEINLVKLIRVTQSRALNFLFCSLLCGFAVGDDAHKIWFSLRDVGICL